MKILLDNNVHVRLGKQIHGHEIWHARDKKWCHLSNGMLISAAEQEGFGVLITCDKNLIFQNHIESKSLSVVVLNSRYQNWGSMLSLVPHLTSILQHELEPGKVYIVNPGSH